MIIHRNLHKTCADILRACEDTNFGPGVSHRHESVMFAANNDCVPASENDSILR
jgi:hypothetical protein